MIWFTSDLHFYHKNVIAYCNRPFACVEEMNEDLIRRWNSIVNVDDTVYLLGDIAFCGPAKLRTIVSRLNGVKHLILGNHDYNNKMHKKDFGFITVNKELELELATNLVVTLSHFPFAGDHTEEERYKEMRPKDNGQWLLHGHVHNAWKVRGRQINVGADVWSFAPVSLPEILEIIQKWRPQSNEKI
jgi:calcineurin-like phosphoesterase family protein